MAEVVILAALAGLTVLLVAWIRWDSTPEPPGPLPWEVEWDDE